MWRVLLLHQCPQSKPYLARQRLKVTAELEDRSNYFLLTFDPTIAFPEEMERFFSFDDAVIYTSFLPEKE